MAELYRQTIVLILAVVLVSACATMPTPTVTFAVPTSPLPTVAPTAAVPLTEISSERQGSMQIKITIENTELTATLIESKTTRDFIALLPLTVTLEDYAGTEKISYLPKPLSTEDAPSGIDPSVGDITYYAPWGNMAIFYNDFGYSSGLVLLGKIDGDMEALNVPGPVTVTIELIE